MNLKEKIESLFGGNAEKIKNEILGNIHNVYGIDTSMSEYETQRDRFISEHDVFLFIQQLRIFITESIIKGDFRTGNSISKFLTLLRNKELKEFMEAIIKKIDVSQKNSEDRIHIDSDTLNKLLLNEISYLIDASLKNFCVLSAFVEKGDSITKKLEDEVEHFLKKGKKTVWLGGRMPGILGLNEIFLSKIDQLQKQGASSYMIDILKHDVESLYLFYFFIKSLSFLTDGGKKKEIGNIIESNQKSFEIFKDVLKRRKEKQDTQAQVAQYYKNTSPTSENQKYFGGIPNNSIAFLVSEKSNGNINIQWFHIIIRLLTKNTFLLGVSEKGNIAILTTLIKLIQEKKITPYDIDAIDTYFSKRNKNDITNIMSIGFDISILRLGLFDISFLAELGKEERILFYTYFIISDDSNIQRLKYPKELIMRIGKDGMENMSQISREILNLSLKTSVYIDVILEHGNTLNQVENALLLLPKEHSCTQELQSLYNKVGEEGFQDISPLQNFMEENKIPLVLHFIHIAKNTDLAKYIPMILMMSDTSRGEIHISTLGFIEKFFHLSYFGQHYIFHIFKNNTINDFLERIGNHFPNTKSLQKFIDFMMLNFPGDIWTIDELPEYIDLMMQQGEKKEVQIISENEEELDEREIIMEVYGLNFSEQIFSEISEKLFPFLISIGGNSSKTIQQLLVHHLVTEKKDQNSTFLEVVEKVIEMLNPLGTQTFYNPEKFFGYCRELKVSDIEPLRQYINSIDFEELLIDAQKYIRIIMKYIKYKKLDILAPDTTQNNLGEIEEKNNHKIASISWKEFERKISTYPEIKKRKNRTGHNIYIGYIKGEFQMFVLPVGKGDVKFYIIQQTIEKLGITREEWNNL